MIGLHRQNVVACALCALILIAAATALAAETGVVRGTVTDTANAPLPGAKVRIEGTVFEATTDAAGQFSIARVPTGAAALTVEFLGYETQQTEVDVAAGSTASVTVVLEPSQRFYGTVTVRAPLLEGQAKALNQQKNAVSIVNVVASDQIGTFPDQNAAESTQRIPGISIQRDQGEGRYVLIRGTEARLNSMQIDGQRLPSPEGDGRDVALDVIPADLLERIEVSKALTPDQDGDAIGGAVNLVMRESIERPRFNVTVGGGHNDLGSGSSETARFDFARMIGDGVGLQLAGSYMDTDRNSDNFEVAWDDDAIEELELRDYDVNRERIGFRGGLRIQPNEELELYFKGTYNQFDDTEIRRRKVNVVEDGEIEREIKDRFESQEIYQLAHGGEMMFDNASRLSYLISYAYAEEDQPAALDSLFIAEDIVFSPDASNPDNLRANPINETVGAFVLDELKLEDGITTEDEIMGTVDYELPMSWSSDRAGLWKLGVKYRDKNKDRNNEAYEYGPEDDVFLTDFLDPGYDPGTTLIDGRYTMGAFWAPSTARDFLNSLNLEREKDYEEDTADYDASEVTYAGYAMAELYIGDRLMILPGLRYELTDVDYTGYEVLFDDEGDWASTNPLEGSNDYGLLLPHLHLRYALDDASNIRVAVTRSFARPNFEDLAPFNLIIEEDMEIERGNPELDVTTSWNLDVLYERYFETVGLVSAGFFYKSLEDYIYAFRFAEIRGGEEFEVIQPRNGDDATLWGLEIAYQNQLRRLPAPLDGLGVYFNYTYADSEAEFPGRTGEKATLPGQSENVGNLALSYEKGGFSARLSYNFHGKYIDEVGEDASEDIYYDDHEQLDLSAGYRFTENLRVFVELNNLTDEPLRYYIGTSDRPIQEEYYSWWGILGIRYAF